MVKEVIKFNVNRVKYKLAVSIFSITGYFLNQMNQSKYNFVQSSYFFLLVFYFLTWRFKSQPRVNTQMPKESYCKRNPKWKHKSQIQNCWPLLNQKQYFSFWSSGSWSETHYRLSQLQQSLFQIHVHTCVWVNLVEITRQLRSSMLALQGNLTLMETGDNHQPYWSAKYTLNIEYNIKQTSYYYHILTPTKPHVKILFWKMINARTTFL